MKGRVGMFWKHIGANCIRNEWVRAPLLEIAGMQEHYFEVNQATKVVCLTLIVLSVKLITVPLKVVKNFFPALCAGLCTPISNCCRYPCRYR
jgi:type IV secretory pathway TraG/TraD family ATPase VirD4